MSVSCYEQNPEAIRDALLDGCGGENLENAVIALAAIVDHLQARLKKVEGTGQQATNTPKDAIALLDNLRKHLNTGNPIPPNAYFHGLINECLAQQHL